MTGEIGRLIRVGRREDTEVCVGMLVASCLVRITGGVPRAGAKVDEVRFYTPEELPRYLATLLQDVVAEVAES